MQPSDPQLFPKDIRVAVYNSNDEASFLQYDGEVQDFPAKEVTIIEAEAAYFFFAVDARGGRLVRDKNAGKDSRSLSYYDTCLIRYGPPSAESRKWFENFSFKIVRTNKKMSVETFNGIK
jgi:hypothetical protein